MTTVLIAADHGLGPGSLWADHGPFAASKEIFLLAIGDLVSGGDGRFTQADLRPTIERLIGLRPTACSGAACGAPIAASAGPELGCEETS